MNTDITLGQYYPSSSPVHRLDAATKIICVLWYMIILFAVNKSAQLLLCFAFLGITVALCRVPFSYFVRSLKPVLILIAFTMIVNAFMTPGTPVWSFWVFKITKEGISRAIFMSVRLIFMVAGASVLTLTTKPMDLTGGLEMLFSPLKRFKFPAHELAMMMTIALRFIPTLTEETNRILKAQKARGADFDSGSLIHRAKALIPLLIPLFVSAFRIASDLALAMEARCYHGGEGRTRLHPAHFSRRDFAALMIMLILTAACVLLSRAAI